MKAYHLCSLIFILVINIFTSICTVQCVNNETFGVKIVTSAGISETRKHDEVLFSGITFVTTDSSQTTNDDNCFQLTTENLQAKSNGTLNTSTKRANLEVSGNTKTGQSTDNKQTSVSNKIYTTISNHKYSTSNLAALLKDTCFSYGSCEFSISDPTWFCRCDNQCNEFNDCCLGFNGSRADRKTLYNVHCLALGSETATYTKGILAVDNCPATYTNSSVIEKCYQNDVVAHGTFVAKNTDIIFKNKFCALCNNITDFIMFEIKLYKVLMSTDELINISSLTGQEKLAVIFASSQYKINIPNGIKPRYCLYNVVENNDSFCQLYINPVVSFTYNRTKVATSHRNYFCVPEEKRNSINCLGEIYINIRDTNVYGLSVIFSFQYVAPKLQTTDYDECETWTVNISSVFKQDTSKVFGNITIVTLKMNNKCQYFETYKDYPVITEFNLISNTNMTDSNWWLVALISIWNFDVANFTSVSAVKLSVEKKGFIARVSALIFITKTTFFHEALRIEREIKNAKVVLSVHDNFTGFEATVSKTEDVFPNASFISTKRMIIQYVPFIDLLPKYNVFIADNIVAFCSSVSIGLVQNIQQIYLAYRTCLSTRMSSEHGVSISGILTYVCFCVSVVALMVLIIVNRRYKRVTSIAMTNLENMSISLLLSNILFMGGIWATHIEKLCYVIGVFLHYLWLTFFSFMTIAVHTIVTTLTNMKSRNPNISYYERRRHCLTMTGLTIPLILLTPSVVVDFFGPPYLSPGYSQSVCFPSQFPANLIFFTGPVICSIGLNLVSITRIIIEICRVRLEISSMIKKARSYQDATIYLRIIVLSGTFWIIGILSVLTDSEWLNYIFTLLCGLHGFFLAVANLTTSRTRQEQMSFNTHVT